MPALSSNRQNTLATLLSSAIDEQNRAQMQHQASTPYAPAIPARESLRTWAKGVGERSSPTGMLTALASEAKRFTDMPIEEKLGQLLGHSGGSLSGLVGHTAWHGSPNLFDKLNPSYIGSSQEGKLFGGRGFSFADNPRDAKMYGENLYKVDIPENVILDLRNRDIYPDVFGNLTPKGAKKPLRDIVKEYETAKKSLKIEDVYVKDLGNGWKEIQWKVNGEWKSPMNNRISNLELSDDPTGLSYAVQHELPENPEKYFSTTAFNPNDVTDAVKKYGKSGVKIHGSIGHVGDEITLFDDQLARILERNSVPTGQVPWSKK